MTVTTGGADAPEAAPCPCGPCIAKAQAKHIRAWHWIGRLDLTRPPAPVLRWLGVILVGIVYAAAGAPTQMGDWLWAAILGGLLVLPDVAGFAIGGFSLDLKKAREDIARLQQDVNAQARASSASTLAIGDSAIAGLFQQLKPEAIRLMNAQATGAVAPWDPEAMDVQPAEDIPS